MAKLTNIKRIIKEDFPSEVQKWIDKLLVPLNNSITQVTFALTNQLTLSDNMLAVVKEITLKGDQFPYQFNHGLKVKPIGCVILQAMETSASPPLFTNGVYAQWDTDGPTITLRTITGLDSSRTYNFTFWIQGG